MKRTGLVRKPSRGATQARKRHAAKRAAAMAEVRPQILVRSEGRCEAHLPRCTGQVEHIHHRKLSSQGGRTDLANCIGVCNWCHLSLIHRLPKWSYRCGLLVRSWQDPAKIPVVPDFWPIPDQAKP